MRIGILADLHGNLPAWNVLHASFKEYGVEQILNLGDTAGLGPDTGEVIDALASSNTPMIHLYGNHDLSILGTETKQEELIRPLEIEHHAYVKERLSDAQRSWLSLLKETHTFDTPSGAVKACHYAIAENGRYYPVLFDPTKDDLHTRFAPDSEQMILYGHHHQPLVIGTRPVFANPGSAGCPHQRAGVARAGILEIKDTSNLFIPVLETYDAEPVIRRIYKSEDPQKWSTLSIFFGVHVS